MEILRVKVLLRQQGVADVMTVTADVSIYEEAKNAVNEVMDKFGSIDVLLNNAGVCPLEISQNLLLGILIGALQLT